MSHERTDVAIVGAGPAGLSAAIEAARAGLRVTVVDENPLPGGQIYRQLPEGFRVTDERVFGKERSRGGALLSEARSLPIRFLHETTAWSLFEPSTLELAASTRSFRLEAKAIVLATGAYDRPVPLPGWTLPGVLTVGGAQTLLKSQRVLPGDRILLAGAGPLQLVVASQLVQAGGRLVAVAEAVRASDVLPHAAALLSAWSITRDGLAYRFRVLRASVPWLAPYVLLRVEGRGRVERATIARCDHEWRPVRGTERVLEVDTVCMGYGLLPSTELARLAGCTLRYDALADAWVPERNRELETSVAGVYAVGDGAGVAGAVVATEEGRLAAFSIARRLGAVVRSDQTEAARARLARLERFRRALDAVYRVRAGLHELAERETLICRCEEVTLGEIDAALEDGAFGVDQVKAWTRAGMGSCQARLCALPTAHRVARRLGVSVEALGCYRPRPPAKPVSIEALVAP